MSLFNLMFTRNIRENSLNHVSHMLADTSTHYSKMRKLHLNHNHIISYYISSVSKNSVKDINESKSYSLARKNFVSRNFITKLFNKYWQETIFLSIPNLLSDNYINQLKSDGLIIDKNQSKKFLLDFNKALVNGRIDFAESIINTNRDTPYIKYVWKKGFHFASPKFFPLISNNKRNQNFPSTRQLFLIESLKQNGFPIFSIINGFNQIVIAEPSDMLLHNRNIIDSIYQWYNNSFLWNKDVTPVYDGLFFINPEDASEYMRDINQKNIYSSKQNNLKIFTGSLDFYYKAVRISPPKIQFRLIPDLKELGELIYKYRYKRNIRFHKQQFYGKDYFQGQPIYFIQSCLAKNKITKKMDLIKYSYKINKYPSEREYEAIFMNYETAIIAWKKFKEQLINYNLPDVPKIMVYNLEDFFKNYEENNQIKQKNILFIPSQDTYRFIKQEKNKKSQFVIPKILASKILYMKVLTTRIIWSLTSRQPMSW